MSRRRRRSMIHSGGGVSPVEDVPNRSIEFVAASNQSLEQSNANWGSYDRNLWAISMWAMRKGDVTNDSLFSKFGSGGANQEFDLSFGVFRAINARTGNATTNGQLATPLEFSAGSGFEANIWYHIFLAFNSAAAAADRLQLFVNKSRIASFDTETQPVGVVNTTTTLVRIGRQSEGSNPANAYVYQPAFFSGVIPDLDDIVTDAITPRDIRGLSGLHSLLHTTDSSTLEEDEVLALDWTNNNSVTKSTEIPT